MREKSLENYYLFIDEIAIDVFKRNGTFYIKVIDRLTCTKKLIFSMNLDLVSANVDYNTIQCVRKVLSDNLELLTDRVEELSL